VPKINERLNEQKMNKQINERTMKKVTRVRKTRLLGVGGEKSNS